MKDNSGLFRMIGKTISGLEDVLAAELDGLGAQDIKIVNRGVSFYGDKKLLYKANYCCRTSLRILMPIAVFKANNEQELYDEIYKIDWTEFLDVKGTFSVAGVTSYSNITHSKYLALKTKDAIVDQFREKFGVRPNVRLDNPDLAINVRIFRNECTVSIDSSGDSLHKRGYRVATGPAPISEVLAAGMVLLSGWEGSTPFIDPMCGSGTIPIEAALIACKIPPGSFREEYSFKHWNNFDESLWLEVKNEADALIDMHIKGSITGTDRSGRVLQTAKENIRSAGVEQVVNLGVDFMNEVQPQPGEGVMITNPPYGERIKASDIENLYAEIGDALKKNFAGYSAWIISSHQEAMKNVGLRPSQNLTVFNGPLECRLSNYEMYEGSKKEKFNKKYEREEQPRKNTHAHSRDKNDFLRDNKRKPAAGKPPRFNRSDDEGDGFKPRNQRKPFNKNEHSNKPFEQRNKRGSYRGDKPAEEFERDDQRKSFGRRETRKPDFKQNDERRGYKKEENADHKKQFGKQNNFNRKEKSRSDKNDTHSIKKPGGKSFRKSKPGDEKRDNPAKNRNRKS